MPPQSLSVALRVRVAMKGNKKVQCSSTPLVLPRVLQAQSITSPTECGSQKCTYEQLWVCQEEHALCEAHLGRVRLTRSRSFAASCFRLAMASEPLPDARARLRSARRPAVRSTARSAAPLRCCSSTSSFLRLSTTWVAAESFLHEAWSSL